MELSEDIAKLVRDYNIPEPILLSGSISGLRWDIPNYYVVDANKDCWIWCVSFAPYTISKDMLIYGLSVDALKEEVRNREEAILKINQIFNIQG